MRVGSALVSPFSAHRAGMSSMWHDVDYVPEKQFETPLVTKMLQEFALPHEEHQLPEGVADPFAKLEQVFDVAAAQMEKGIQGLSFLNGKTRPTAEMSDARDVSPKAATPSHAPVQGSPADRMALDSMRLDTEHARRMGDAAATPIATRTQGTRTAAQADAEAATPQAGAPGDVLDSLATFVPMAASQAVVGGAQGPLPALAAQATASVTAVVTAGEVVSVGVTAGLTDEPPIPRRGLRRS